jgi:ribosomal protein L40E
MNAWKALGYVFTVFGIVFLTVAVIVALPVLSSINFLGQYSTEAFLSRFIAAILPYVIAASIMFVIAAGGFYAGRPRRTVYTRGRNYSRIRCGECGAMNDIDAVFCKRCGNHFR